MALLPPLLAHRPPHRPLHRHQKCCRLPVRPVVSPKFVLLPVRPFSSQKILSRKQMCYYFRDERAGHFRQFVAVCSAAVARFPRKSRNAKLHSYHKICPATHSQPTCESAPTTSQTCAAPHNTTEALLSLPKPKWDAFCDMGWGEHQFDQYGSSSDLDLDLSVDVLGVTVTARDLDSS